MSIVYTGTTPTGWVFVSILLLMVVFVIWRAVSVYKTDKLLNAQREKIIKKFNTTAEDLLSRMKKDM